MQEKTGKRTPDPKAETPEITNQVNSHHSTEAIAAATGHAAAQSVADISGIPWPVGTPDLATPQVVPAGSVAMHSGSAAADADVYSDEEEELVTQRLKDLGYL